MAKNTVKKIKELNGVKPEKISNEQLNKIQTIVNNINSCRLDIGNIEIQKQGLINMVSELNNQLSGLRDEFKKEFGTDDINIHTGEINYGSNETNS